MCVLVHVSTSVREYTTSSACTYLYSMHVYIRIYVYIRVCASIYTRILSICVLSTCGSCMCVYTCMCGYLRSCMHAYVYVRVGVCLFLYVCMCV